VSLGGKKTEQRSTLGCDLGDVVRRRAVPQLSFILDVLSSASLKVLLPITGIGTPPPRALDELHRDNVKLDWCVVLTRAVRVWVRLVRLWATIEYRCDQKKAASVVPLLKVL
jgi:hypothetical protein